MQRYRVLILLLCYLSSSCYSYHIKIGSHRKIIIRKLASNENIDNLLSPKNSPGFTSNKPISITTNGRQDTIQFVLTLTVIWFVLSDKLNQLQEKIRPLMPKQIVDVQLGDGISYQDIVVGSKQPQSNENIKISLQMTYNGMVFQPDEFIKESRIDNCLIFEYNNDLSMNVESAYRIDGLNKYKVLEGLQIGSKRKIRMPVTKAFTSNQNLPFIVSRDGYISIDISMDELSE